MNTLTQEQSGAASWTTDQRRTFANDLNNPQLIAVTDNLNQAKGDQGPEDWQPPLGKTNETSGSMALLIGNDVASYRCTYAKMWVKVKSVYALTVTASEKSALNDMLATC